MKNILIPTDFSLNSKQAIEFAFRLFMGQKAKFYIINSYFPPIAGPEIAVSVTDMLKQQSEKEMKVLIEELRNDVRYEELDIVTECIYGDVEFVVEKQAQKCKADFVVMGTKGASGVKEILVGSVTSSVLKSMNIPMIIIPEGAKYKGIKNILLAVDYKETKTEVIKPLINIASIDLAEITVLNVHEGNAPAEETEKHGLAFTEELKVVKHHHCFKDDNSVVEGIEHYVEEHNIDLVTMIKHQRNFWDDLFHKSATQKLCMHTHIPLMVLSD